MPVSVICHYLNMAYIETCCGPMWSPIVCSDCIMLVFCVLVKDSENFIACHGITEEKSEDKVDIHMYFGGRFREKPRLHYTGTHMAIFKDRIEDQLSIVSLCRMFKKVDEGATRVTFWFCVPDVDLEGGLHPIRDNNDIELMNQCYWNLPKERLIYACSGDEPFEKEPEDGGVSNGIKNECPDTTCGHEDGGVTNTTGTGACEDDEEPEWLKDGLETIEDEDIFSPKKDAVGDSNYNNKNGAGADGDIKKGDGTTASSKLPMHLFSFAGKTDEKVLLKGVL